MRKSLTRAISLFGALALGSLLSSDGPAQAATSDEQTVWNLEHSYWHFVETNDLASYRNLWHDNFLGWPSVSPAPVRKEHITDWISSQTSQGLTFRLVDFKSAAIQRTGGIIVVHYWVRCLWIGKTVDSTPYTLRVTHTWLKTSTSWQILSGMSMPQPDSR
jgi:Domain of unknown function (DUF4440)